MPKFAKRYEILRGVRCTSRKPCNVQPSGMPIRVGLLLNEKKFVESGGLIAHHDTVFLDDRTHDWDWWEGVFFYYGHGAGLEDAVDVVVILEEEDREVGAPKFDSETGKPLATV